MVADPYTGSALADPDYVMIDTLDLQDHNAPSAKDHTRQPTHSSGVAPHQEQTLRHADDVIKSEMMHGPGVEDDHPEAGYGDGIDIYDDDDDDIEERDELGHHHHKGDSGGSEEGDLADGESDDMMDDDLMDKISSSPSIDDGAFRLFWFFREYVDIPVSHNPPVSKHLICPQPSSSGPWLTLTRGHRF